MGKRGARRRSASVVESMREAEREWARRHLLNIRRGKPKRALLVIDVQYDFLPGGSLAVQSGHDIIPVINMLRRRTGWNLVVFSKDWHPSNHMSFFTNNRGTKPLDVKQMEDGESQVMWPPHAVQGSRGAELHPTLDKQSEDKIVLKGTNSQVDSYSAFWDNGRKAKTNMEDLLKAAGIQEVYVTGLALDYCVGYSCMDAIACGFKTFLVEDAARGINPAGCEATKENFIKAGGVVVRAADIV